MGKADTNESNGEDDDDDTTSRNPHLPDSEAAIEEYTDTDNNSTTNQNAYDVGATTITRKRTTIDESTLSAEDLQKLESRRAYNRHCAAKGTLTSMQFYVS